MLSVHLLMEFRADPRKALGRSAGGASPDSRWAQMP